MIRLLLKYFFTLLDLSLIYVCPCVCVSSLKEMARRYDQTTSRSFFTLCVSVWLCVLSKRDGQVIMIRLLLKYFFTLLDLSLIYVCPCVCVSSLKEMVRRS